MAIHIEPFGELDGRPVRAFSLSNENGLEATVVEYGATLVRMLVPDARGERADVVLGYDDLPAYRRSPTYFGATAGRYGNRIREGRFPLGGADIQLGCNEGRNHLHGGFDGFDRRIWTGVPDDGRDSVTFHLVSPDGDEGFPGELSLATTYRLTAANQLLIRIVATTTRTTIVNVVHHSYWNLGGHDSGPVTEHEVKIEADFYTPCDEELLPTGEILAVADTPFDFRQPTRVGRSIGAIANAGGGRSEDSNAGYDHNWVLRGQDGSVRRAVSARDPASGRTMVLSCNQPGVHFYTGGYLGPSIVGKGGHPYCRFAGFTLETQTFPDSPNLTHFPSPRLDPGEVYDHRMALSFGWGATGDRPS